MVRTWTLPVTMITMPVDVITTFENKLKSLDKSLTFGLLLSDYIVRLIFAFSSDNHKYFLRISPRALNSSP